MPQLRRAAGATLVALLALEATAGADEISPVALPPVQFHGFVSQGFMVTTENNYLTRSERGSFEFAEAGLNATSPVTDRLRVGMQVFARDLGPIGDYRIALDWFYLDYRWRDWLGVRAGRVKLPFGLYNDTSDVDPAHGVVLLPQSVYPVQNRDFLLAQTGAELYGYQPIGAAGALDYRVYGGTIFIEVEEEPGNPIELLAFTIPYVVGARLMWEPPVEGLRLGGSVQALRLESDLLVPGVPEPVEADIPALLWIGSLEYAHRDLLVAAEYSRWYLSAETSHPELFPESSVVNERAYGLVSYRFAPWLQAGAYYSLLFPDVDDRSGRDAKQHDVAATLRFDVNLNWLIKLEAHYLHGTAALEGDLNDGRDPAELADDWALFLAKTTAYF